MPTTARHLRALAPVLGLALFVTLAAASGCSQQVQPSEEASQCPTPQTLCSGLCVDLGSNATSCGTCGNTCTTGSSCSSGACQCFAGNLACANGCINPVEDGTNCGACGVVCGADAPFCSLGACSATCAPGLQACGTSCADLMTSESHCGACGVVCSNGTECVAGACTCPAGTTCDTGTPPGTGGSGNTGGGSGTGGDSTMGTGGSTGSSDFGGYHVHGDWAGFAFTFQAGGATITPSNFEDMKTMDGPYCVSGTVLGTPPSCPDCMDGYTSIAALGFNTSQPKVDNAPVNKVATQGDGGLYLKIKVNGGSQGIRVQLEDGTDPEAADAAEHRWCANLDLEAYTPDAEGYVEITTPWGAFNTQCWDTNAGTGFDGREIAKVIIYVPDAGAGGDQTFDFCVGDIGPSNVPSRGTGEIVANCGNSGVAWSGDITDQYGQVASGNYQFQMNGWNLTNGNMVATLLSGAGFRMKTQTCNTSTSAPCSFPSVYTGTDADGTKTSGFTPTQIANIGSVPTCLGWSSNGTSGQEYNIAYDVWFNSNSGANYAEEFLMVWFHDPPSFQPGGMFPKQDGVVIGDQTWAVWQGPNHANQNVVTYMSPNPLADGQAYSFNLKDFIDDAVDRGYLTPSLYLISVMGGMEIWGGGQGASIDGFRAQIQ